MCRRIFEFKEVKVFFFMDIEPRKFFCPWKVTYKTLQQKGNNLMQVLNL
jgi:hypothetical protein